MTSTPTTSNNNIVKFIILTSSVYVSYLLYGMAQEKITKQTFGPSHQKWTYSLSLIWFQFIFQSLVAFVLLKNNGSFKKRASKFNFRESLRNPDMQIEWLGSTYRYYTYCAISSATAMFSTNAALRYIDYPSQILVKSCKILAVLLAQVLFLRKSFPRSQYLSVLFLTTGILLFSFSRMKNNSDKESTALGYVLLFCSLFFDGVTACVQETTVKKHKPSPTQMMFAINIISLLGVSILVFANGEIFKAIELIKQDRSLLLNILFYGITAACGQAFIFSLVAYYGSLATVIVTTTRKFFSILLSVIIFNHKMNIYSWIAVAFVFVGLGLNIKKKTPKSEKIN